MSAEPKFYSWSGVAAEQLNPLLSRQLVSGDQAMISRLFLAAGCLVPEHQHPNEQIATVVSGALRFVLGQPGATVEHVLRAGDLLVIPGNVPHSAEALEDTVNIDIFAPPRQDWLRGDDAYLRAPQRS